jgi:pimeloyl-ACP methyl ester carboxylesterase
MHALRRAFLVAAAAFDLPLLHRAVEAATPAPLASETVVEGLPATLYVPPGRGRAPTALLLNGATPLGRRHPRLVRLASGLSRAGLAVLVPDLPGLPRGEVTQDGVRGAVACARWLRGEEGEDGVALLGISAGTTVALLAAEEEELARGVSVVAGTTCYTDLRDLMRLATTGTHATREGPRRYRASSFLALCVARSVCAGLEEEKARRALAEALEGVAEDDPDPLAPLRRLRPEGLEEEARAVLLLLANRDPRRFDELYAALPERTKAKVDRLSPLSGAERLRAPVELLVDPVDKYFPLEHALALARASPCVRVTVSEALSHVDARRSPRLVLDLPRVGAFLVRVLAAACVR